MLQTKTFNITKNHQHKAAENFQGTASLFAPSCIEKFTSESVLSQQQTSVLSQQQTSVMSQQQTSVLSQQQTSVLSQQQTYPLLHEQTSVLSQHTMLMSQKSQLWQCHNVHVADRRSGPKSSKVARNGSRMVART